MATMFTLSKRDQQGIHLEDWTAFISRSDVVRAVPPKLGTNPFTKKPATFHPAPGSATLDGPWGNCLCEYRDGQVIITAPGDDVIPVVEEIAKAMGAAIQISRSE